MIIVSRSFEIGPIPLFLAHMGFLMMVVAMGVLIYYLLVNTSGSGRIEKIITGVSIGLFDMVSVLARLVLILVVDMQGILGFVQDSRHCDCVG